MIRTNCDWRQVNRRPCHTKHYSGVFAGCIATTNFIRQVVPRKVCPPAYSAGVLRKYHKQCICSYKFIERKRHEHHHLHRRPGCRHRLLAFFFRFALSLLQARTIGVVRHCGGPVRKDAYDADVFGQHVEHLHGVSFPFDGRTDGLVIPAWITTGQYP